MVSETILFDKPNMIIYNEYTLLDRVKGGWGWRLRIIHKQEDLIDLFEDIGPFNIDKDIKTHIKKNHLDLKKVLQEIEATCKLKNYKVIYEDVHCDATKMKKMLLIKTRIANPQNNKGASSGFRVLAIVNECEDYIILIQIYPKDGSGGKDNLTSEEKKTAKAMFHELFE